MDAKQLKSYQDKNSVPISMSDKVITMGAFGTYSEMEKSLLDSIRSTGTLTPHHLGQVGTYQAFLFTGKKKLSQMCP